MLEGIVAVRLILGRYLKNSAGGIAQATQHSERFGPSAVGHDQVVARGGADQHDRDATLGEGSADRRREARQLGRKWGHQQNHAEPILSGIGGGQRLGKRGAQEKCRLEWIVDPGAKALGEEGLRRGRRRTTPVPEQAEVVLEQHRVEGSERRD